MDVQNFEFEDNTFDTVVSSFAFCSVPDLARGLMEVERVCKSGCKVVLLEHVLSANRILAWVMNLANQKDQYQQAPFASEGRWDKANALIV